MRSPDVRFDVADAGHKGSNNGLAKIPVWDGYGAAAVAVTPAACRRRLKSSTAGSCSLR